MVSNLSARPMIAEEAVKKLLNEPQEERVSGSLQHLCRASASEEAVKKLLADAQRLTPALSKRWS